MTNDSPFTISAFGDEIAPDLEEQLKTLQQLELDIDVRAAWGKNVADFSDDDMSRARQLCDQYGVTVRCIGSPIGKSPLIDPIENELTRLAHVIKVGKALGTDNIRIFSFYPPDDDFDKHLPESIERLKQLANLAQEQGAQLLLENEKEIIGDTAERCLKLMEGVDHPSMGFIWDPANFVQVGEAEQVDKHWQTLSPHLTYVHIKDALLADGTVKPAGEGDGQVPELIQKLKASGYTGVLSLEPHLVEAGHSTGFSGAEGMAIAAKALRNLL